MSSFSIKSYSGTFLALLVSALSNAQTQPSYEAVWGSSANPGASGPTAAAQTYNLRSNPENPAPAGSFLSSGINYTISITDQQYGPGTPHPGSRIGMRFGESHGNSYAIFPLMDDGQIGAPYQYQFTSVPPAESHGIELYRNRVTELYVSSLALEQANNNNTGGRIRMGDIRIQFNQPVTNPVLHFTDMGAHTGVQVGGIQVAQYLSAEFNVLTPNVSLLKLDGDPDFTISGSQINNANSQPDGYAGALNASGFANGSVLVQGSNITTLDLRVFLRGSGGPYWAAPDVNNSSISIQSGDGIGIGVSLPNPPPVATDNEDLANPLGPVSQQIITENDGYGIDSDPYGEALELSSIDLNPASPGQQTSLTVSGEGVWTVNNSGVVTFTPQPGFTQDPTPIQYTISDAAGQASNAATITVDYAPVAANDTSANNMTGSPIVLNPLVNDTAGDTVDPTTVSLDATSVGGTCVTSDAEGNCILVTVSNEGFWAVDPVSGTVTFTPEGSFSANPAPITYSVADEEGNIATASIMISYQIPLPVDLVRFDAVLNGEEVLLTWATAQEQNCSHFEIERSTDGKAFVFIGRVAASGTGSTVQEYALADRDPENGQNFYRLKQVDEGGTFRYSSVRSVLVARGVGASKIFPNPAVRGAVVQVAGNGIHKLEVYSAEGRLVAAYRPASSAATSVRIATDKLSPGNYTILVDGKTAYRLVIVD